MNILSEISISNISVNELVIAIVGYLIVFIALVSLYALFRAMPGFLYLNFRRDMLKRGKKVEEQEKKMISGEETAAIAMALQLFFDEMHDEESGVLTIKKVSKAYSPWSSKIYAVRNQFNRI
jgi:hypothetical protein